MTAADLRDVARLHAEAFPRFFLSGLGLRTLREMYAGMLADTTGITIVAETGGRVIGFAAGTTDARSYYRRLFVRRWWRFALAMIPALLRHPSLAARLLWRVRSATTASPRTGEAVLLSLAVAPPEAGRGAGRLLVRAFLDAVRSRGGLRRVSLTTDAAENDQVEAFYQSLGFTRNAAYSTPENRLMHEYVIDL
jgi:GNAT superfamily N-acetyltransferase